MNTEHIRQSIAGVAGHFETHPQDAQSTDSKAVATLEDGLRCRATGPNGAVMTSDMPAVLGGGGSAPTPGWLLRAALANCDATVIAMRAAQLGITLDHLEVTVDSHSDDRGLIGVADVPAGPLALRVMVRITAPGSSPELLHELVRWAEAHSPVADALRRAVPVHTELVVDGSR
jgi:uncharacterized OsmC-like protein